MIKGLGFKYIGYTFDGTYKIPTAIQFSRGIDFDNPIYYFCYLRLSLYIFTLYLVFCHSLSFCLRNSLLLFCIHIIF